MKKFLSVISIVLLILVVCSVSSLATEPNAQESERTKNKVQTIGATNTNKSKNNTNTNKAANKTVDREDNEVETNVVGSTNKTNSNKTNTNKTNSSNYNSSNGSSKLPYAGTGTTSVVLIALAFAGSAVYAYKKVTDYNL